jgi:hypothetical protein
MYLLGTKWEGKNWIYLAQARLKIAGCCEHGNEPPTTIKGKAFRELLK